jgi:uncharacterized protein (TIGR00251 family)
MNRKYEFHDGKRGSALALRITPRADRNEITGVLEDGTIKVHIAAQTDDVANTELVVFLAEVLGVPKTRVEVVAGASGRDKLVSILDMDVETAHQRILAHMS